MLKKRVVYSFSTPQLCTVTALWECASAVPSSERRVRDPEGKHSGAFSCIPQVPDATVARSLKT